MVGFQRGWGHLTGTTFQVGDSWVIKYYILLLEQVIETFKVLKVIERQVIKTVWWLILIIIVEYQSIYDGI